MGDLAAWALAVGLLALPVVLTSRSGHERGWACDDLRPFAQTGRVPDLEGARLETAPRPSPRAGAPRLSHGADVRIIGERSCGFGAPTERFYLVVAEQDGLQDGFVPARAVRIAAGPAGR